MVVSTAQSAETRVATLAAGEVFGEMALLTDEPRSATVRADTAGRVLRLPRDRFLEMLRREPGAPLAVTTTLSRRLAARNAAQIESEQYLGAALARALHDLPADCRAAVLDACVLDEVSDDALRALFGAAADRVRTDLSTIGIRWETADMLVKGDEAAGREGKAKDIEAVDLERGERCRGIGLLGSWGGRRPSLASYVATDGISDGATTRGPCSC